LQLDAKQTSAYFFRGRTYYYYGKYAESIADITKSLEYFSSDDDAHYFRGLSYYGLRKFPESITEFTNCVDVNPKADNCYRYRGYNYVATREYLKAIADYDKSFELDPKDTDIYRSRAWAYLYLNNGDKAYEQAATFLELNGLKDTTAPYVIIPGYLGLRKAKKDFGAKAFLQTWLPQVKPEAWTTSILKYFHGDMDRRSAFRTGDRQ